MIRRDDTLKDLQTRFNLQRDVGFHCLISTRVEFTELSTNINKIIYLLNISGGISAKHHKAEERGRFKQLMFCLVTPAKLRPPGLCPMSTFQEVSAVFQHRAPVF